MQEKREEVKKIVEEEEREKNILRQQEEEEQKEETLRLKDYVVVKWRMEGKKKAKEMEVERAKTLRYVIDEIGGWESGSKIVNFDSSSAISSLGMGAIACLLAQFFTNRSMLFMSFPCKRRPV